MTSTASAVVRTQGVVNLSDAVIAVGQRANQRIDELTRDVEAKQQALRKAWIDLGRALLVGKAQCKNDRDFGRWVKEYGFANRIQTIRSAAMKMSVLTPTSLARVPIEKTHPQVILKHLRDEARAATPSAIPADLRNEPPPAPKVFVVRRVAERLSKLIKRKKGKGEGSDIAERAIAAYAKQYETTEEALEEAVKIAAPDAYHEFDDETLEVIAVLRASLQTNTASMEEFGISRDAIKSVFLNYAYSL